MTPSLVVTLLVGMSPPVDFVSVPLAVEGASVVREAPELFKLLEDMGIGVWAEYDTGATETD